MFISENFISGGCVHFLVLAEVKTIFPIAKKSNQVTIKFVPFFVGGFVLCFILGIFWGERRERGL